MTKREQLEKSVVDTEAAFDDDKAAFDYSVYAIYKAATYVAWSKAKRELEDYLKEHGDEH